MVECLPCRSRGKLFHHQVCDVWRHWWHSKIPDITWDVGHSFNLLIMYYVRGFAWAWMALRARNLSPSWLANLNPQSTCNGPRPGPQTFVRGAGGLPACHGAENTRKDPRPEEKKNAQGPKKHINIYVYKVNLQDMPKWNPEGNASWKGTRR